MKPTAFTDAVKLPDGPALGREVYFVRALKLGLIKIGQTDCALTRLGNMQTGSPDRLELLGVIIGGDAVAVERSLHRRFARSRLHGEWFRPSEALLAYIAEHATSPRPRKKPGEIREVNEWDALIEAAPRLVARSPRPPSPTGIG